MAVKFFNRQRILERISIVFEGRYRVQSGRVFGEALLSEQIETAAPSPVDY